MTQDWGVKGKEQGRREGKKQIEGNHHSITKAKQMYVFARESHSVRVQQLTSLASWQQVIFLKDNNKLY